MSWLGLASVRARRRALLGRRAGLLELTGHRAAHEAVEVELEVGVVGGTDRVERSPAGRERLQRGGWSPAKESAVASAHAPIRGTACPGGARRAAPRTHACARGRGRLRSTAFQAAAASTAQRRPGVEVSARVEGGFGPLAHAGRRTIEGLADERGDDPQTQLGVGLGVGVEGPGDRGAEVVELGVEAQEPRGLVGSFQAGPGSFGEVGVVLGVAAAVVPRSRRCRRGVRARTGAGSRADESGVVPSGPSSSWIIDLAARSSRASRTSHAASSSPPATAVAASASKLPANTPRRSKTMRSRSSSSE